MQMKYKTDSEQNAPGVVDMSPHYLLKPVCPNFRIITLVILKLSYTIIISNTVTKSEYDFVNF